MKAIRHVIPDRLSNPGTAGIGLIAGSLGILLAGDYKFAIIFFVFALACIAIFHKPMQQHDSEDVREPSDIDEEE